MKLLIWALGAPTVGFIFAGLRLVERSVQDAICAREEKAFSTVRRQNNVCGENWKKQVARTHTSVAASQRVRPKPSPSATRPSQIAYATLI